MASSFKTKRPRTSGSKSNKGESSSKFNPLNLTRLLANDEQRKVFEEHFHGRTIFTPKYGNIGNFEFEDFLFPYLLQQQNLFDFCCEENDIYPELVRVFYCKINFRKNLLTSHVKGKDIVLDTKTFNSLCCDILMQGDITGFGLVCEWDDYDRKAFYLSLCRISKEKIEQRNSQSLLPYAIFITKILEHFGVSLDGETKVALNIRESKIDIEVFHKMRFTLDPVTRRTYRHRTDQPTAPTAQPEPTIPDQLEFQAPSSSSAAIPSNQMIMNELVSLRGYFTTRMDALDTQN
ncbi:hypothetical protein Lal_00042199 [Lupinus albus]|nr:hypothetical protein Lal_00042199 [Lupinus albus]